MQKQLSRFLAEAVAARLFPGAVVGWTDQGGQSWVETVGRLTYEADAPEVKVDTIYDLASITKSIPTASLLLRLIDRGQVKLSTPVEQILPDFKPRLSPDLKAQLKDESIPTITLQHLLEFALTFNLKLSQLKDLPPQEILNRVLEAELTRLPGERVGFVNAISILTSLVVEKVAGHKLEDLARQVFFEPLGMNRTAFLSIEKNLSHKFFPQEIAPSEIDPWRGREIRGEVHDESAWQLSQIMNPGSAGLFATGPDLLKFLTMVLNSPYLQVPMGWEVDPWWAKSPTCPTQIKPSVVQPHQLGKTGFTGCFVLLDLDQHQGLVFLANASYPHRPADRETFNKFRTKLIQMIFKS